MNCSSLSESHLCYPLWMGFRDHIREMVCLCFFSKSSSWFFPALLRGFSTDTFSWAFTWLQAANIAIIEARTWKWTRSYLWQVFVHLLDHYVYIKIYHKHLDFPTRRATYCRLVLVCCMQHVAQEETREELSMLWWYCFLAFGDSCSFYLEGGKKMIKTNFGNVGLSKHSPQQQGTYVHT